MKLVFFDRLENGNVLWSCDNCNNTAEVSCSDTRAVALYCMCTRSIHPPGNADWYNKLQYYNKELKAKYEPDKADS